MHSICTNAVGSIVANFLGAVFANAPIGVCSEGAAPPKNWPVGLTMFFWKLLLVLLNN